MWPKGLNFSFERMTDMGWDFANHLFNSVIQYVITGAFCVLCAIGGICLRERKNKKQLKEADK